MPREPPAERLMAMNISAHAAAGGLYSFKSWYAGRLAPVRRGLVAANVPVAPVLDRAGMLASAPFPRFPIRLARAEAELPVPAVDEHRGQGFAPRP